MCSTNQRNLKVRGPRKVFHLGNFGGNAPWFFKVHGKMKKVPEVEKGLMTAR